MTTSFNINLGHNLYLGGLGDSYKESVDAEDTITSVSFLTTKPSSGNPLRALAAQVTLHSSQITQSAALFQLSQLSAERNPYVSELASHKASVDALSTHLGATKPVPTLSFGKVTQTNFSDHKELFLHKLAVAGLETRINDLASTNPSWNFKQLKPWYFNQIKQVVEEFEQLPNESEKLKLRHQFVQLFSQDLPGFDKVREAFGNMMYQHLPSYSKGYADRFTTNKPWLSPKELAQMCPEDPMSELYSRATYFHTTRIEGIEGILTSRKILVQKKIGYPGAFVRTQPIFALGHYFGDFILIFNRKIENLPVLNIHCEKWGSQPYCDVGFAKPIPVTAETLECVAIRDVENPDDLKKYQERFSKLAGREIKVINAWHFNHYIDKRDETLGIFVPSHWDINKKNELHPIPEGANDDTE